MPMLKQSLRAQILLLLAASLTLILITALAGFAILSGSIQAYRGLLEGPMQTSRLIDEANLEFKVQVQEWKNVLLRGQDEASLATYWNQFEEQEQRVQALLEALVRTTPDAALKNQVELLRREHRALPKKLR